MAQRTARDPRTGTMGDDLDFFQIWEILSQEFPEVLAMQVAYLRRFRRVGKRPCKQVSGIGICLPVVGDDLPVSIAGRLCEVGDESGKLLTSVGICITVCP